MTNLSEELERIRHHLALSVAKPSEVGKVDTAVYNTTC